MKYIFYLKGKKKKKKKAALRLQTSEWHETSPASIQAHLLSTLSERDLSECLTHFVYMFFPGQYWVRTDIEVSD